MKHCWIALIAFVSLKTFAASPPPQTSLPYPTISNQGSLPYPDAVASTLISIPQLSKGVIFGISGFYLQPSSTNGDSDYAVINSTIPGFRSSLKRVDFGYNVGWGANVGYIFPNTGNDANVSYFYLGTKDTDPSEARDAIFLNPGAQPVGLAKLQGDVEYTINQVDITAGQFINVGKYIMLHPITGVRWVQIYRQIFNTDAIFADDGSVSSIHDDEFSSFHGLGPLVGFDARYAIVGELGAVAHVNSAVIAGYIYSQTNSFFDGAQGLITNSINTRNTVRIVPVVDGKFGLYYRVADVAGVPSNTALTFEAGWQVSSYFNAVDRLYVTQIGPEGTIRERNTSAVRTSGPYLNLVLHI